MKKLLRTIEIADAYQLLDCAKYQVLPDEEKIRLWKISRVIKPIALQFLGDKQDAVKSFITQEFAETYKRVKDYAGKGDNGGLTEKEYLTEAQKVLSVNRLMEDALGELADKEVELEFEPISEESLGKLIVSNNWEFSKTGLIEWMTDK